jgi:hypothetical protein
MNSIDRKTLWLLIVVDSVLTILCIGVIVSFLLGGVKESDRFPGGVIVAAAVVLNVFTIPLTYREFVRRPTRVCPLCGSTKVTIRNADKKNEFRFRYENMCANCNHIWEPAPTLFERVIARGLGVYLVLIGMCVIGLGALAILAIASTKVESVTPGGWIALRFVVGALFFAGISVVGVGIQMAVKSRSKPKKGRESGGFFRPQK